MRTFTHSMVIALGLVGAQGAAWAQDDDTGMGGDVDTSMGTDTTTTETPVATTTMSGGGYAGLHSGLEGVTVPLFASDFGALVAAINAGNGANTTVPTANFIWGLNPDAAIDLQVGVIFAKTQDDPVNMTQGGTRFGLAVGAGYRMIHTMKGKIRPWIEPGIRIADGDVAHTGDVIGIGAFAELGFEYLISDQLTIGTHIGVDASFTDKFKTITIATDTGVVDLGFWW